MEECWGSCDFRRLVSDVPPDIIEEPDNRAEYAVPDGTSEDGIAALIIAANESLQSSNKLAITNYSSDKQNNVAYTLKEVYQVDSAARKYARTRVYTINGAANVGYIQYIDDTTIYNYSENDWYNDSQNNETYCKTTYHLPCPYLLIAAAAGITPAGLRHLRVPSKP
jgi:hypothetical protein